MAGPWEKYGAAETGKPWDKYGRAQPTPPHTPTPGPIKGSGLGALLPLSVTRQGNLQWDTPPIYDAVVDALSLPGDVAAGKAPMWGADEAGRPVMDPQTSMRMTGLSTIVTPASRALKTTAAAPTTEALKARANTAYDAAKNANLTVSPNAMLDMATKISDDATKAGIDKTLHPRATAALKRVEDAVGSAPSLQQLDIYRQIIGDAAKSADAGERRIAKIMMKRLDDSIESLTPADVISGDAQAANAAIREARSSWASMRKAETVETAQAKARRGTDASGSGGNINNRLRQEVKNILNSPSKMRGFTADEKALMEKVVAGSPVQNLLRLVGKLSPEGNGLMQNIALYGGVATGGGSLPFHIAGLAAKRAADAATEKNMRLLLSAVQSGGVKVSQLTMKQRQALEAYMRGAGVSAAQPQ